MRENGAIKAGYSYAGDHRRRRWKAGAATLPLSMRGAAAERRLDDLVDRVVAMAMRLPSLCALDYADAGGVSTSVLATILGCSQERARILVNEAIHERDIQIARGLRAEARERARLFQIRRRPAPPMSPGPARVGDGPRYVGAMPKGSDDVST